MSLRLYYHPLASFCHKVLIALYENDVPFDPVIVDLGDAALRAEFEAVWPMAKMPVLRDDRRTCTVAESTVIIEYLDAHYPGATRFVPRDADGAWQVRMWDRFYDLYVQAPMQKIVTDRLRPESRNDSFGVQQAAADLRAAYRVAAAQMSSKTWTMGDDFTLADCSAAPALFYANTVVPFDDDDAVLAAYLDRLMARTSFARVLAEAEPFFPLFPLDPKPRIGRPDAPANT